MLSREEVDVVLSGPRDRAELDEALAALDRGPMDEEEIAWMKRVGAHVKLRSPVGGNRVIALLDRVM